MAHSGSSKPPWLKVLDMTLFVYTLSKVVDALDKYGEEVMYSRSSTVCAVSDVASLASAINTEANKFKHYPLQPTTVDKLQQSIAQNFTKDNGTVMWAEDNEVLGPEDETPWSVTYELMRETKAVNKKRAADEALAKEIEKKARKVADQTPEGLRWEDVQRFVKKKGYRLTFDTKSQWQSCVDLFLWFLVFLQHSNLKFQPTILLTIRLKSSSRGADKVKHFK